MGSVLTSRPAKLGTAFRETALPIPKTQHQIVMHTSSGPAKQPLALQFVRCVWDRAGKVQSGANLNRLARDGH